MSSDPAYFDCNATSPLEPRVLDLVIQYLTEDFGNAGSRTHEYGAKAKQAVQRAREQVAAVVTAGADEVVFTSGATEANNLALLGLAAHGERTGRRHVITTAIEHKAVLEPIEELQTRGFDVTIIPVSEKGWVDPELVIQALRPDTILVSVMHANNETGVLQPIVEIAAGLADHTAYFHVDAAQSYGKEIQSLRTRRVDLISISGHKVYGPKGIGALVCRRRGYERVPLRPLLFGGGQERGLRPGTLPVHLIAGFGLAAEIAANEHVVRAERCRVIRRNVVETFEQLGGIANGDAACVLPHVVNVSLPGLDAEAVMVTLKDVVAMSNGAACTSQSYSESHVLTAMGLPSNRIRSALRLSWCHLTSEPHWPDVVSRLGALR